MKNILFVIAFLGSLASFGQTSIKFNLYDKDSVALVGSIGALSGDEIIIRSTFTYTFPDDMDNPFVIKIADVIVFDGTVQDWADTGFSIHTILPELAPNPAPNTYIYPIYLNGIKETGIKINPKPTTGIINPLDSVEKITYYDLSGLKIEKPNEGLYLWKSENGESGKIYIGAN